MRATAIPPSPAHSEDDSPSASARLLSPPRAQRIVSGRGTTAAPGLRPLAMGLSPHREVSCGSDGSRLLSMSVRPARFVSTISHSLSSCCMICITCRLRLRSQRAAAAGGARAGEFRFAPSPVLLDLFTSNAKGASRDGGSAYLNSRPLCIVNLAFSHHLLTRLSPVHLLDSCPTCLNKRCPRRI